MIKFEWDINKEKLNIKNHGVGFDVAVDALRDEYGLEDFDDSHSDFTEYRYSRIGLSRQGVLFVIYTLRETEEIYRLISARKAEISEEILYWEARDEQ